jgi:CBS domain-containing protein
MKGLSPQELERIERFVAAFNVIDDWLQRQMPSPMAFRAAVDFFAKRNPWWSDADALRTFAALRNFLVHEKTVPFAYPCVPTEDAVLQIEEIRVRLTDPPRAGETFGRAVLTLSPGDTLFHALGLMRERGVTVFPVYDGKRFVGLLTATGITRWLAAHSMEECIDLRATVQDVLARERKRQIVRWASLNAPVAELAFWFRDNTFLEAILLSDNATEQGTLRGIATRGDVAGI